MASIPPSQQPQQKAPHGAHGPARRLLCLLQLGQQFVVEWHNRLHNSNGANLPRNTRENQPRNVALETSPLHGRSPPPSPHPWRAELRDAPAPRANILSYSSSRARRARPSTTAHHHHHHTLGGRSSATPLPPRVNILSYSSSRARRARPSTTAHHHHHHTLGGRSSATPLPPRVNILSYSSSRARRARPSTTAHHHHHHTLGGRSSATPLTPERFRELM